MNRLICQKSETLLKGFNAELSLRPYMRIKRLLLVKNVKLGIDPDLLTTLNAAY